MNGKMFAVLGMITGIMSIANAAPVYEGIEAVAKPKKKLYLLGVSVSYAKVYATTDVIKAIQRTGGDSQGAFLFDESCVEILTSDTDPFEKLNQLPWPDFYLPAQTVYVELTPQDFQRVHDQINLTQIGGSIASVFTPPSGGSEDSSLSASISDSNCSFNKLCLEKGSQEGEEKVTTELQCSGFTMELSTEGEFKPGIKTKFGSFTLP